MPAVEAQLILSDQAFIQCKTKRDAECCKPVGDDVNIYYSPKRREDEMLLSNGPSLRGADSPSQSCCERHSKGLTLSRYPQQPSEEYAADTLRLLHKKFGLDPSCEFRLKDRAGRYYSLRNLPGGQYDLELTSHVTGIPQNSIDKEGVRATVTGSARILAEAYQTRLQVTGSSFMIRVRRRRVHNLAAAEHSSFPE